MAHTVLGRGDMRWIILLATVLGCVACGKPAVVVEPEVPVVEKIDRGPISMEGEFGGLNEDEVADTFERLQSPIFACVADGASRLRELGGHFALSLRIDKQGNVRSAYLSASTLGDRATERCVLDVVKSASWPRPLGGDGLAQRSFDVDAGVEPVAWKEERVRPALRDVSRQFARCRRGHTGRFMATAYVRPDGRVVSAGVAPPSAEGEEAADCMVSALQKLRLGSPGRKSAKVTFEI